MKKSFIKLENGVLAQILSETKDKAENSDLKIVTPRFEDASVEKHVPFVEEKENGYLVKVGKEVKHPMEEAHWIEFIEIEVDNNLYRRYLNPKEEPEVFFQVPKGDKVVAREYCNLHGLWQNK